MEPTARTASWARARTDRPDRADRVDGSPPAVLAVNGWLAVAGAVVVVGVAATRELLRWRGRRWEGGMRPGRDRRD